MREELGGMATAVSAWESCGGVSMVRQNAEAPMGEEVESRGDETKLDKEKLPTTIPGA